MFLIVYYQEKWDGRSIGKYGAEEKFKQDFGGETISGFQNTWNAKA